MFTVTVDIKQEHNRVRYLSFVVNRALPVREEEIEALVNHLIRSLGVWQRAVPGLKYVDCLVSRDDD